MKPYIVRKRKAMRDLERRMREEEFQRGLKEWREWIKDERSRATIAKRARQESDWDGSKSFLIGVLAGAKRSGMFDYLYAEQKKTPGKRSVGARKKPKRRKATARKKVSIRTPIKKGRMQRRKAKPGVMRR